MADSTDVVSVSCNAETFHKWAHGEVAACAAEPFASRAKRMKHFSGVIAQVSKALDAREFPAGFTVTMETAFAPLAGNGITVMPGITTPADYQAAKEFQTPSALSKAFGDLAARIDAHLSKEMEAVINTPPPAPAPADTAGASTDPKNWKF